MRQAIAEHLESRRLLAAVPALIFLPPRLQSVHAGVGAEFSLGRLKAVAAAGPFTVDVNWNDGSANAVVVAAKPGVLPRSPQVFDTTGLHTVDVSLSNSQGLTAAGEFKIRVLPATGGIVGTVFREITGSRGRSALVGYTFYLDLEQDGQLDAGDPTAISNIQGVYRFSGLLPGVYRVEQLVGSQTQVSSPAARYEDIAVARRVARAVPFVDLVPAKPATRITLTTVAALNQPPTGDISFLQVDSEGDIVAALDRGAVPPETRDGGPGGTLLRIPAGSRNLQVPAGCSWFDDGILGDITYLELDTSGHLYYADYTAVGGNPSAYTERLNANDGIGDGDGFDQTSPPIFDQAGDAFIAEQPISYPEPSTANAVFEIPANTNDIKTIANFNTSSPYNLTMDSAGNIYGQLANYDTNFDEAGPTSVSLFEIASGSRAISTLYTFPDASDPEITDLVSDSSGDLFATTENSNNSGAVIELPAGASTITQLGSFDSAPSPDLTLDPSGNLFGEVPTGGSSGKGEIFEVPAKTGTLSGIFSFEAGDGNHPDGLIIDTAGNLFGITSSGGRFNGGTVFKIDAGTLQLSTLVNFKPSSGSDPTVGLYADGNGNLYGAVEVGGPYGNGRIFKLSGAGYVPAPRPGATVTGQLTAGGTPVVDVTISITGKNGSDQQSTTTDVNGDYSFKGLANGQYTVQIDTPAGYERQTPASGVYDVTINSANLTGENFSLTKGTLTTIAQFDGSDGSAPGDMVMDSAGNLFGVTASGGADNDGTVFELPAGSSTIKTVASFDGTDGSDPVGKLYIDPAGDIFGTTQNSSSGGFGTVFEIPAGTNMIVTLHAFSYSDGSYSTSGIVADAAGNLYGTTSGFSGGLYDTPAGTIFKISAGSHSFTTLVAQIGIAPTGTMVIDPKGDLFSGNTSGGLIELPAGASSITTIATDEYSDGTPTGIIKDSAGNFYIGTDGAGLLEIPAGANTATSYGPAESPENPITTGVPAIDANGDIFGAAGDTSGDGSIYEVVAGSGIATAIFSSSVISSADPVGNLIADSHGDLFGTTAAGGSNGDGSIFEISGAGFVTNN